MELTSRSAIRGVAPDDVAQAVGTYLDVTGLARALDPVDAGVPQVVRVAEQRGGWTTLTWPSYFAPRDVTACGWLSRELHTVVSAVTTTDDEGWSHTLVGCGTELDRFHSYPAALAWDEDDVLALTADWGGDYELVARVMGVEPCTLRRHFCQATPARRDHPGRERDSYLALWAALGIRPPADDEPPFAVVMVEPGWHRSRGTLTTG